MGILSTDERRIINNAAGLLVECLHNWRKGQILGWMGGEQEIIKNTINELEGLLEE